MPMLCSVLRALCSALCALCSVLCPVTLCQQIYSCGKVKTTYTCIRAVARVSPRLKLLALSIRGLASSSGSHGGPPTRGKGGERVGLWKASGGLDPPLTEGVIWTV